MFTSLTARASNQAAQRASAQAVRSLSSVSRSLYKAHPKNCMLPCCKGASNQASRAFSSMSNRLTKSHAKNCKLPCCSSMHTQSQRALTTLSSRVTKGHKNCQLPCCKAAVTVQKRKMGSGPTPQWHLLGTRQADYIQEYNQFGELPPPPGHVMTYPFLYLFSWRNMFVSLGIFAGLYQVTRPIRVQVEKVEVTHPQTGEKVYLNKPINIMRDENSIHSYDLVHAPEISYTRLESIMAERLMVYNEEMDMWLQGADASKFRQFTPDVAFMKERENPEHYKPVE